MDGSDGERAPRPAGVELGGGMRLRAAREADVGDIVALETAAFGASDEPGVRGHLAHPGSLENWAVVTAPEPSSPGGERVVSASALLLHRMALDGAPLVGGQIEYVATDPRFQRRGLVRAAFGQHHRRAEELGLHALFIGGIPYLYRRFGYGYGLDFPDIRIPTGVEPADRRPHRELVVRPFVGADLDAVRRIDAARPPTGLRVVRDAAAWSTAVTICAANPYEHLLVAERAGDVVGWARTQHKPEDRRLYVACAAVAPGQPATTTAALVARSRELAGDCVTVVYDSPGTTYGAHLAELERCGELGAALRHDHGLYVRVPDPVRVLDAVREVLTARLAASRYAELHRTLVLSLYRSGVEIVIEGGKVVDVRHCVGVEDPFGDGGVGVAPDWFGALVFGRFGAAGLAERADDVTLGRQRRLMEVLFPRRSADVIGDF